MRRKYGWFLIPILLLAAALVLNERTDRSSSRCCDPRYRALQSTVYLPSPTKRRRCVEGYGWSMHNPVIIGPDCPGNWSILRRAWRKPGVQSRGRRTPRPSRQRSPRGACGPKGRRRPRFALDAHSCTFEDKPGRRTAKQTATRAYP